MSLSFKITLAVATSILIFTAIGVAKINQREVSPQAPIEPSKPNTVQLPDLNTIEALTAHFKQIEYNWPIASLKEMPDTLLTAVPNNLAQAASVTIKKQLFIQILLPIIVAEQAVMLEKRKRVVNLIQQSGNSLSSTSNPWFAGLIKEYRINRNLDSSAQIEELLKRIDTLPVELIITQAAIESGWGTSRFAVEGNSLFGEWTFGENAGLTPNNRQSGKTHQVKKFDSLQHSIRSYVKNINRNNAYKELREARYEMRKQGRVLDARKLANYLHRYSQKGMAYVDSLQLIMNTKELKTVRKLNFDHSGSPSS